jgi:hypothetical protein
MAASKGESRGRKSRRPPATTLEGREKQLVSLAVELAEKQMRDGSATSQVITHYLKLGTTRELLEQERLRQENELLKAKIDSIASQAKTDEMYREALEAMRRYAGNVGTEEDDQADLYRSNSDSRLP